MKYNLELLKADILDELKNLERLETEFAKLEKFLKMEPEQIDFHDRAAVGYCLHSFYNGCENIFRSIAGFFENDLPPQSWHSDMLKRMRMEIPGFRPAVVDSELYRLLNDFRAFRHVFRHAYSFDLDWEKEHLVAMKFRMTHRLFQEQIHLFLKHMDDIEKESGFDLESG